MKNLTLVSLFASAALATACGGGGGGGGAALAPAPAPGPAAPTYDAQTAWVNLLSTTRSWTVSGIASDGKRYDLLFSTQASGTAVFPLTGVASGTSTFRNLISQASTVQQDAVNEQFFDAQYRMLGARVSVANSAPSCSKTDVVAAVPQNGVNSGTTGPLYAATSYPDCVPGSASVGTSFHTWSVLAENGFVYLCVSSANRVVGETVDRVSETCVETDTAGNLGTHSRIKLTLPGYSITATN